MFQEFPKALTNADGEQMLVEDAEAEKAANGAGWFFGGPHPLDHDSDGRKGGARKRKAD